MTAGRRRRREEEQIIDLMAGRGRRWALGMLFV